MTEIAAARSSLCLIPGPLRGCDVLASAKGNSVAGEQTAFEARGSSACSDCGTEMVILRITPILFGGKFEDLTLACKKCGSTKEIRIKRS
jgi:hypothetical protein